MRRHCLCTAFTAWIAFAASAPGAIMRVDFAGSFSTPAGSTPGIQGTPIVGATLTPQTTFDGFFTYDTASPPTFTSPTVNRYANSLLSFHVTLHPASGDVIIIADQLTGSFAVPFGAGTINVPLDQLVQEQPAGEDVFGTTCGQTGAGGGQPVHILLDLVTSTGDSAFSGLALPENFDASKFIAGSSTFRLLTDFSGQRATGGLTSVALSQVPAPSAAVPFLAALGTLIARQRRRI